jgi:hypothetical protein
MTTDASDALRALGIDPDSAIQTDNALKDRSSDKDKRVCLCGHGMSKHKEIAGVVMCKPSRMDCPCKKSRAVLDVEDTRVFLRRTVGGGMMHALSRGLSALVSSGKSATWIVELKCDRCGSVDEIVSPVPVTQSGHATTYATGYDALLCQSCREEV